MIEERNCRDCKLYQADIPSDRGLLCWPPGDSVAEDCDSYEKRFTISKKTIWTVAGILAIGSIILRILL